MPLPMFPQFAREGHIPYQICTRYRYNHRYISEEYPIENKWKKKQIHGSRLVGYFIWKQPSPWQPPYEHPAPYPCDLTRTHATSHDVCHWLQQVGGWASSDHLVHFPVFHPILCPRIAWFLSNPDSKLKQLLVTSSSRQQLLVLQAHGARLSTPACIQRCPWHGSSKLASSRR